MTFSLDGAGFSYTCPNCGSQSQQTIGGVKANPHFTCTCGQVINFDTSTIPAAEAEINRMVSDFGKKL